MRIAINGFGRIGRTVAKLVLNDPSMELVAINDLADGDTMAHLFQYDSIHGVLKEHVSFENNAIKVDDVTIPYYSIKEVDKLPWADLKVDYVLECTGLFKSKELASQHIKAGAKKVIVSAPSDSSDVKTIVLGVNEETLNSSDTIISNASCTTNSAAPLIAVLDKLCKIQSGYITTVHSYTGDQKLHDTPHKDLRRARAAALSIVPTTTGAAKAITRIFPHLEGDFGGCGIRVPVPDGSLTDITCMVENPIAIEEINQVFKEASENELKGILEYQDRPIVSVDIVGNPYSCIYDAQLTSVIGNMVKVVGWYDNEMGYSSRLVDLLRYVHTL